MSKRINNKRFIENSKNKARATWHVIKNKLDASNNHNEVDRIIVKGRDVTDPAELCKLICVQ